MAYSTLDFLLVHGSGDSVGSGTVAGEEISNIRNSVVIRQDKNSVILAMLMTR